MFSHKLRDTEQERSSVLKGSVGKLGHVINFVSVSECVLYDCRYCNIVKFLGTGLSKDKNCIDSANENAYS